MAGLLVPRILRILALRRAPFREVARDPRARLQGALVLALAGVIEATVREVVHGRTAADLLVLGVGVVATLVGWFLWTALYWFVAVQLFGEEERFGVIGTGMAFCHATTLPYGLALVPSLLRWEGLVMATTLLWFVATLYPLTRGLLGVSPRRALRILAVVAAGRIFLEFVPYGVRLVPGG